jgi:hypothetical protein
MASPLFQLDGYEKTNAVRFSQNAILYRSPTAAVSIRITDPLRVMCGIAIEDHKKLMNIETDILTIFKYTDDCLNHISSLPIEDINAVLTENEKKRGLLSLDEKKDTSNLRVSPNSPLAAQVIGDKVIEMLVLITLRHFKAFKEWKKNATQNEQAGILKQETMGGAQSMKSVQFTETAAGSAFDQ